MVAVSNMEELRDKCGKLEQEELESQLSTGRAGGELYCELLAGYIALDRLPEAKFLWKRIPDNVKQEFPELANIWEVGTSIWNRDNPKVFLNLEVKWSPLVLPTMDIIRQSYRNRALELVSAAYSTIKMSDLSLYLGLNDTEVVNLVKPLGWSINTQSGMVSPVQMPRDTSKHKDVLSSQLQRVTQFISYLEN